MDTPHAGTGTPAGPRYHAYVTHGGIWKAHCREPRLTGGGITRTAAVASLTEKLAEWTGIPSRQISISTTGEPG